MGGAGVNRAGGSSESGRRLHCTKLELMGKKEPPFMFIWVQEQGRRAENPEIFLYWLPQAVTGTYQTLCLLSPSPVAPCGLFRLDLCKREVDRTLLATHHHKSMAVLWHSSSHHLWSTPVNEVFTFGSLTSRKLLIQHYKLLSKIKPAKTEKWKTVG